MIIIRTADQLEHVLATSLDPLLLSILEGHRDRLAEYTDCALGDLVAFFVFEPGDPPDALHDAAGIALMDAPPRWEYLDRHDGWFELVFVISDFGEGLVILIPDAPGTNQALLELCRTYA